MNIAVKQKWQILLVEDDSSIGEPLKQLLEWEGYTVQWEKSGFSALAWLKKETPHLILLDIMMPEMDGWEFREEQLKMGKEAAEIPVFILSADRRAEMRVDPSRNEAFLPKPIDVNYLADRIASKLTEVYEK